VKAGVGTYWRTLRHLKAQQFSARLRFKLLRPRPECGPPDLLRDRKGPWALPARREPSLTPPTRLRLLNVERDLEACGWDDPSIDKLWRYNLHYFDDLNAIGSPERTEAQRVLVSRWISDNPPAQGSGWEPYPVSLRIVNWIKWALSGQPLEPAWHHSLAVQARWLRRRLEFHLLGNHLFANAKALVFAGLFFDGAESAEWLDCGRAILEREVGEQVLADGGHFERSPMYHALAVEDALDLINVITAYGMATPPALDELAQRLRSLVPSMLAWLRVMTHPDGGLGLFNDTAQGIAPAHPELERYALALSLSAPPSESSGVVQLPDSGYIRVARGPAVALLDVAPIGPDYLPGHAHADTLSFELSLGRQRVVINGGTSRYGNGPERQRERSTAAHSTAEVAGQDSSEVWAGFRVGRRAHPVSLSVSASGDEWQVACAHDGYTHLPGRPMHRRQWTFRADGLSVADTVSPGALPAVARYLLAPEVSAHQLGPSQWEICVGGERLATVDIERGDARLDNAQCASRFGIVSPTRCLTVSFHQGQAVTHWTWHDDAHPVSD
jgi:uncharacterized heparinase superfamily protein